ncbi:SRPBCC family protein [Flavobacterium sp. WV_118_3]|jgi:ligand-binding SRPBCC domain-containing protein|uniref:SRPBCC family protein n=1 Tax=Flavobacterium sp. WV_118_3 TaxID=3151764 RepID=UPI002CDA1D62|nr:SRPBCC family protein [Flavobacterium sp.]
MRLYTLHTRQKLPVSLNEAWAFFSDPSNLNAITPENLKFQTLSGDDRKMFSGQIIHYKISPFRGIQRQWVTAIPPMEPNAFFVDEQRFGPYKFWHHKHFFREIDGGIEMEDLFGCIRNLLHPLLVRPKLKAIFDYRKNKLKQLFGRYPG